MTFIIILRTQLAVYNGGRVLFFITSLENSIVLKLYKVIRMEEEI